MTQVTILWVASATATLFGESQIFPLSIGFYLFFPSILILYFQKQNSPHIMSFLELIPTFFQQNEEQPCLCVVVKVRHIFIQSK